MQRIIADCNMQSKCRESRKLLKVMKDTRSVIYTELLAYRYCGFISFWKIFLKSRGSITYICAFETICFKVGEAYRLATLTILSRSNPMRPLLLSRTLKGSFFLFFFIELSHVHIPKYKYCA